MTVFHHNFIGSPLGSILVTFCDDDLAGLFLPFHPSYKSNWGKCTSSAISKLLQEQIHQYMMGERKSFDVPIYFQGTEFQRKVWEALQLIPFGETRSYCELAEMIDSPNASRAVGNANGKNPIGIIVPCHRVITASGKLGGYSGGYTAKRWLLEHEKINK